jgi:hypothetical protein
VRFLIALIVGLLLGIFGRQAEAGHCKSFFVQKVVAVPVYQQPVYYSVGDDIRLNALAQKIVDRAGPQIAALVAQQINAPPALQQAVVRLERCAGCHDGTKARDFSGGLTADEYASFSKMIGLNDYSHVSPEAKQAMAPVISKIQAEGKVGEVIEAALKAVQPSQPVDRPPPPPKPEGGLQ